MELYYSGASVNGATQHDPWLSLGGRVSSSRVPNGAKNNVFPTITKQDVTGNTVAGRLLVLKNTTGGAVSNIKIWVSDSEQYCQYELAVLLPATVDGSPMFEKIHSATGELPYQGVFTRNTSEGEAITITSLANNACVGIWLKRTLLLDEFNDIEKGDARQLTNDQIEAILTSTENSPTQDTTGLKVKWS